MKHNGIPQIFKHPCDDGVSPEMRRAGEDWGHGLKLDSARETVEAMLVGLVKKNWRLEAKPGKYDFDGKVYTFRLTLSAPDLGKDIETYACNRASAFALALGLLFQREIDHG